MTAFELVQKQAEDEGLWFHAETASEAYLQAALLELHYQVELEHGPMVIRAVNRSGHPDGALYAEVVPPAEFDDEGNPHG